MKLRLLFGILFLASAIACASHNPLPLVGTSSPASLDTAATPTPRAVISLTKIPGASTKAGMEIFLRVGGDRLRRQFLFDSGSQGLWIYFNALHGTYQSTGVPAKNTYGSGIVYNGTVVMADVTFFTNHGTQTVKRVPMVRVESATCDDASCPASPSADNCPKVAQNPPKDPGVAGVLCLEEGRKLFGTFGADVQPSVEATTLPSGKKREVAIYNLLLELASSFIINQTEVQIAPNPLAAERFVKIAMTPLPVTLPTTLPHGAKPYEARFNLCYTVGRYFQKPYCQRSEFDTGASNVDFKDSFKQTIPTVAVQCPGGSIKFAEKGITVVAYAVFDGKKHVVGTFKTGYTQNYNALVFSTPRATESPEVNTGLTFYNRAEILFDAAKGHVGVYPLAEPGDVGTAKCS